MKHLSKIVLGATALLTMGFISHTGAQVPQAVPGLNPVLEAELQPMIQRVYKNNKAEFNGVMARLEKYITDASPNNTKRRIAADIHVLMQKMDQGTQNIPTLSDSQVETLLAHLPSVPADRGIVILEFSDLQCPFCARHHNNGTLETVSNKHPYASAYFMDFPLSFHAQANPGAMMRQCVQRHAGYDAMKLYVAKAFETSFNTSDHVTQALYDLGYDDTKQQPILDCYNNKETQKGVTSQMDLGRSLGVTGTPGNIIIDRYTKQYTKISGAVPATSFEPVLTAMRNGDTSIYPSNRPAIRNIQPSHMKPVAAPRPTPVPSAGSKVNQSAYDTFKSGAPVMAGPSNAKISIIEFSDFQCPFCQRHANNGTLETVQAKYGNDVNVYFGHFPLSFHANAQKAGEAYECAREQGGAKEFKKAFFKAGGNSNMDIAKQAATDSGLDADVLMTCVDSGKYAQKVKDHMAFGQSLSVTGTPGNIVINNETGEYRKISGAVPAASFDSVITAMKNGEAINAPIPAPVPTPAAPKQINDQAYSDFLDTVQIDGNTNAKVSIIEFSDVQCPFCQRHVNNGTLQTVKEKYGDDVNLIFAHFPLSFHANAQKAGEAIECSIEQGGVDTYFAFKKEYFARGGNSSMDIAKTAATNIGINPDTLMDCVDSGKYAQRVKDHMAFGQSLGVTGTPGNIVVNNETLEYVKVSGAVPAASFDGPVSNYLK